MAEACGSRPRRSRRWRWATGCRSRSRRRCAIRPPARRLVAVPLDVLVVAAYGLILPPEVLGWPRAGCLNIHASLLPRWRGAAPIARAIEAGDAATGITIMQMDAGLDTGPMIDVRRRRRSRRATRRRRWTRSWRPPGPPRSSPRSARAARRDGTLAVDAAAGRRRDLRGEDRPRGSRDRLAPSRPPRSTGASARSIRRPARSRALDGDRRQAARGPTVGDARTRRRRPGTLLPARGVLRVACGRRADEGRLAIARLQAGRQPLDGRCGRSLAGRALDAGARFAPAAAKADRCSIEQAQAARAVARGARRRAAVGGARGVDDGSRCAGARWSQELAYGTLRHWGTLDGDRARGSRRSRSSTPMFARCSRVALYQLGTRAHRPSPIVDRAVDAAVALGHPRAEGLVNALLRRYLRERAALDAARASTIRSRAGRTRAGGSSACAATDPTHWQAILAAGNARPPLTLRVNVRATTRDALLARLRTARIDAHAGGRVGHHRRPAATGDRAARLRRGRVRGAGPRRAARGAAARPAPTACACSTRAPRPAARRRTSSNSADVELTALDSDDGAACRACATTSRACGMTARRVRVVGGRRGRAARLVGRPSVRPHPRRRAVHRIGRRAPPSRRQVAAPRDRRRRVLPPSRTASSTRRGRCSRRAACCST